MTKEEYERIWQSGKEEGELRLQTKINALTWEKNILKEALWLACSKFGANYNEANILRDRFYNTAKERELYKQAMGIANYKGQVSISMLQRKLYIGYFQAAKLLEKMEKEGHIEPKQEGTCMRRWLRGKMKDSSEVKLWL